MGLADITVDTNVLMHGSNKNENRFEYAVAFLQKLLGSDASLCVDEGFDVVESKNRSLIGCEYLKHLVYGELGHFVVAHLAQCGRVAIISRGVSQADRRKINQLISNRRDRTFVCVSINSSDHVLVSHDFGDFPAGKRSEIKNSFGVVMIDAEKAIGEIE